MGFPQRKTSLREAVVVLMFSVASAVALQVSPAAAQGPPVPFATQTLINVWDGLSDQNWWPAVAYNPVQDEFLVVWQHWGGSSSCEIFAQRVARNGLLIDSPIPVTVGLTSTLPIPAAVAFAPSHGGYLVVYPRPVSVSDFEIAGRWVAWDGAVDPTEITIADGAGSRELPDIAYNPIDDEFLVVWMNVWPGGSRDIDARRLDAGTLASLSWANVATGPEFRMDPHVAFDEAGGKYLITYSREATMAFDIAAKSAVASLLGVSVAPEIEVCAGTGCDTYGNELASANGEFLVAWTNDTAATNDIDIRARRVSGEGVPQGPNTGFAIETFQSVTSWGGQVGDVSHVPGYGYVVVWSTPGGSVDLWACSVLTGHDAPWGTPFSIDSSAETQTFAALASARPEGDMFVVFSDGWSTGDVTYDLRGYLFSSGVVVFGDDFENGTSANWSSTTP